MTITRVYIVQSRVSTHSRPKAAGFVTVGLPWFCVCFNTQPPEGGWKRVVLLPSGGCSFNTQPPEGGWPYFWQCRQRLSKCFNTQPPEGGWNSLHSKPCSKNCFNTQPPEGGWSWNEKLIWSIKAVSTHSRPKAAGYSL